MSTNTTSRGDGLSDSGTAYLLSAIDDYVTSDFTVSSGGTYTSGGFDSLGNAYTSKPVMITDVSVRVGGSFDGYTSSGRYQPLISSQKDGTPSTKSGGNTTPGSSTVTATTDGNFKYAAFVGTTYYYGFEELGVGNTIVFGRGGSSGTIYRNGTTTFSSSRISGSITQDSIPNEPTSFAVNSASITPTSMQFTWVAPTDDGGSSCTIKGYRINYKTNSSSTWSVLIANTGSNATTATVTGLSPSTSYDFEIAALNETTDLHNNSDYSSITSHVGVRSSTVSANTISDHQIKVFVGGEFKNGIVKVWDGTEFKTVANANVSLWTGSAFKNVKLT